MWERRGGKEEGNVVKEKKREKDRGKGERWVGKRKVGMGNMDVEEKRGE